MDHHQVRPPRAGRLKIRKTLYLLPLLALGFLSSCGRTVNDFLQEAASGVREDISYAISEIQAILVAKERAGEEFTEGDLQAIAYLKGVASKGLNRLNRAEAIACLGQLTTQYSDDLFVEYLGDDFWLARLEAVEAIQRLGSQKMVGPLLNVLAEEEQTEVRLELIKSLGVLGGDMATKTLFETFLVPLNRQSDEQLHAFLALKDLTGLEYQISERRKWQEAYEKRFHNKEAGGSGS